ncbi:magnesium chelatase subunit D [Roseivivax halotolerans]|uniref:Magnesium chelatase subunit D n=1 Tax=Roseivivax halotolerans TaxID=93684 RepID=A0A1I5VE35_9RHOB|nr:magnesium chelatase subunit D [Roseivivax halotolerans]SFQ05652.1 magnesium chelatase subunit D [Roseivivax halotolerans]
MKQDRTEAWIAGHLALSLLAVDPAGLGGLRLRARASPVRDAFLDAAPDMLRPFLRITPAMADEALFGGTDIAESLSQGRLVVRKGVIAQSGTRLVTMSERLSRGRATRLAQVMDARPSDATLLLDEGIDGEAAPMALCDRLAFEIDLDGVRTVDLGELALGAADISAARERLEKITLPDETLTDLVVTAARYGIASLRAPLFALAAARAHAALYRRNSVMEDDLIAAVQLVYAHRATMMPEDDFETDTPEEDPATPEEQDESDSRETGIPDDLLIDAVRAVLPEGALSALSGQGAQRSGQGAGGAGYRRKGNRRGRPLPSIAGMPSSDSRLDLVATLRAAAPWQKMRRAAEPERSGLILSRSDFRVKRYEERSDRLIIFVVDASGSSAMTRLAEAKGAVETLLANAYASRDHVALVSFRGRDAQLLLPPTRSLVQAKRALGGLPGGGGTPLASGLKVAADVAERARGQGLSPSIAVMTDGRANIGLEGEGRKAAMTDAALMARRIAAMALPALVLDTNTRAKSDLSDLARQMGATYMPLPRADSASISKSVTDALRS